MPDREKAIKDVEQAIEILSKVDEPTFWLDFVRVAVENALKLLKGQTTSGWVSVKDRMPEPHEKNDHEADLMLYIPKREGVHQHGIFLGFLRKEPLPPDNGSGNFWGLPCPGSDWTAWGWSHFEEPIVTHWMPIPTPPEEVNGDG